MHDLAVDLASSEYYFVEGCRDRNPKPEMQRIHYFYAESALLPNLFSDYNLKCVRVLCLIQCDLKELSEEVGKLIHLRYLDLSWINRIEELPETLCDLYNLQTLDLQGCRNLTKLPHAIEKLVKLKHLFLHGSGVREFPHGFRKLTELWTLDVFIATSDSIGYLENLNELNGHLEINFIGKNMEVSEAEKVNLKSKSQLKSLGLVFDSDVKMDVIDVMVPPPGLSSLDVSDWGNQLPCWITTITPMITNLKMLTVCWYKVSWYSLPSLDKLPMLETLNLRSMKFKRVGLIEFLGSGGGFSKLKTLSFWNCSSWEEWEDLKEEEEDGVTVLLGMPSWRKCNSGVALS